MVARRVASQRLAGAAAVHELSISAACMLASPCTLLCTGSSLQEEWFSPAADVRVRLAALGMLHMS